MQSHRTTTLSRLLGASAAALLLLAGSGLSQDAPPPTHADTLRGPSVKDRAMPRDERFASSMLEGRHRGHAGEFRIFIASVRSLAAHTDPGLKLSEDQERALSAIENDYRRELRAYMQDSREQTQNLRQRIQLAREQAGDDPAAMERIMERAQARAQEIRAAAPTTRKAEAQAWDMLTPAQRRFVTTEVERLSEQVREQREQQRQESMEGAPERSAPRPGARPSQDRPAAGEHPTDDSRPRAREGGRDQGREAAGTAPGDRRWAQLFERIQKLTPQQQQRLFNMISSTVDRVEASERAPDRRD